MLLSSTKSPKVSSMIVFVLFCLLDSEIIRILEISREFSFFSLSLSLCYTIPIYGMVHVGQGAGLSPLQGV